MQPLGNYIKQPSYLLDSLVHNYGKWLPDGIYIKLRYRFQMGKWLNLDNPRTFQEKISWLKLHDHNPKYTMMVDKIKVKDYVSSLVGSEFVVPLLGVWNSPEDIDWDKLPEKFVLKTNHGGGNTGVVICRDKSSLDKNWVIAKLKESLRNDIYIQLREWPYKNVERKVFAEEFIEPNSQSTDLTDFKWFCFNGEPLFCQVIQDRNTKETIDFFDSTWKHQEFVGLNPNVTNAKVLPECPSSLNTHIRIAKMLSEGIPFCRIDLYEANGKTYFGEITFYPASGIGKFEPAIWNYKLGECLKLPQTIYK